MFTFVVQDESCLLAFIKCLLIVSVRHDEGFPNVRYPCVSNAACFVSHDHPRFVVRQHEGLFVVLCLFLFMSSQGSMVTMDMRMDRVRVWCDADGIVTRPPRIG